MDWKGFSLSKNFLLTRGFINVAYFIDREKQEEEINDKKSSRVWAIDWKKELDTESNMAPI